MIVKPINLRLYRRFDADLIALNEHIPVNVIIEVLLDAYAEGRRIRIIPAKCRPFNIGNKKGIHLTVTVRSQQASNLIAQIKPGFRNQFCKSLLRDALVTDPLWVYFSDNGYTKRENERIRSIIKNEEVIVLPWGLKKKEYRDILGGVIKPEDIPVQVETETTVETSKSNTDEKPKEELVFKPKLDLSNIEGWKDTDEENPKESDQDFYDAFDSLFGGD